ncbi:MULTISPECIES: hypothetical protein [unclassified Phenylobacterium]|uniref:hypothetical protein n=1 Tax=unclassified Phenylobacterium TaxID=2640670 RepID=UPI00083ADDE5|nr:MULTISPECIES: hypothetical protein [unclassified Phenylobacterium]
MLDATDALNMSAQGAMWIYSHALGDWRYYLVTSLVDSIGRRKTYKLLVDAFERLDLPEEMTVEDVHLGSPSDPLFQAISGAIGVPPGVRGEFTLKDCSINGLQFDGMIYRSDMRPTLPKDAARIERAFERKVREVTRA